MNYEIELINSIIDNNALSECIDKNIENVFEVHTDIWSYIVDYNTKYKAIPTKNIVKEHFKMFEMLNTESVPLQYFIDEARKQSLAMNVRGSMNRAMKILQESGPQAALSFMTSQTTKLMKENGILKDTNLTDFNDRLEDFKKRYESDTTILGIPTDIRPIDEIFGGMQGGDFIVLMAWTGQAKTWLALLLACNAWRAGYRPLYISLEMNKHQIAYRIDTILGGGELKNSELTHARGLDPEDYKSWAEKTFSDKHPFYIVTAEGMDTATQYTVQSKIDQYNPDVVFLDYHGLFEDGDRSGGEVEKTKSLSKAFKRMAIKNDIPIVDIVAVTMENGHGTRPPELNEVSWSKQLVYDADLVLALYRGMDSEVIEVVSRKTRRCGPLGFYLDWDLDAGIWSERFTAANGNF